MNRLREVKRRLERLVHLIVRIAKRLWKRELAYQDFLYLSRFHFLLKLGLTDRAKRVLERELAAADQQPRHRGVAGRLALFYEQAMDFEQALKYWRLAEPASEIWNGLYCQALLKDPDATNASLLDAHRQWAARWTAEHTNTPKAGNGNTFRVVDEVGSRPLKIGFTCSFWDTSTIRCQFLSWIKHLDNSQFQRFFYVGSLVALPHLDRYGDFLRYTPKARVTDAEFAKTVQKDEIDILVELNGYTNGHRFGAMARRCAPVQVSYLNHTATCGVPNVDYVIADPICVPAEDQYYTEGVYRLPRCFFCFNFEDEDMPISHEPPVVTNGFITFGFFGAPSKFNNRFIRLMAAVLEATDGSKLLMANSGLTFTEHRNNLVRRFAALGIDPARLLLYPGQTRRGIAKLHTQVDITLDSWPYCGGNTLAESLWYGVPAITLKGDRFSSRYGASILAAAGVPDLIADSEDEYVRLSAMLGADVSRLADFRLDLRQMMSGEGKFSDTKAFARDMAHAFEEMIRQTATKETATT